MLPTGTFDTHPSERPPYRPFRVQAPAPSDQEGTILTLGDYDTIEQARAGACGLKRAEILTRRGSAASILELPAGAADIPIRGRDVASGIVDDVFVAPTIEDLRCDIGSLCYLKLVPGMSNPHKVSIDGVEVAPEWDPTGKTVPAGRGMLSGMLMNELIPTDRPRMFKIAGVQHNFKGEACYTIRLLRDPAEGTSLCANPKDVIFVPGSPRKLPPATAVSEGCVVESDYASAPPVITVIATQKASGKVRILTEADVAEATEHCRRHSAPTSADFEVALKHFKQHRAAYAVGDRLRGQPLTAEQAREIRNNVSNTIGDDFDQ